MILNGVKTISSTCQLYARCVHGCMDILAFDRSLKAQPPTFIACSS